MENDGEKVLREYKKKFNKLPAQPHHLIAFSKSRSDLPTINYGKAKAAMNSAKEKNGQKLNNDNKGKLVPKKQKKIMPIPVPMLIQNQKKNHYQNQRAQET